MRLLEIASESLPKTVLLVVYLVNSEDAGVTLFISLALALVNTVSGLDLYAAEFRPELARVQSPDGTPETPVQKLKRRLDLVVDGPTATTPESITRAWSGDDAPADDANSLFGFSVLLADIAIGKGLPLRRRAVGRLHHVQPVRSATRCPT